MSVHIVKFGHMVLKSCSWLGYQHRSIPTRHFLNIEEKKGNRPSWIYSAAFFPLFLLFQEKGRVSNILSENITRKKTFRTHINIMYGRLPVIIQLMITGVFMYSTYLDSLELTIQHLTYL